MKGKFSLISNFFHSDKTVFCTLPIRNSFACQYKITEQFDISLLESPVAVNSKWIHKCGKICNQFQVYSKMLLMTITSKIGSVYWKWSGEIFLLLKKFVPSWQFNCKNQLGLIGWVLFCIKPFSYLAKSRYLNHT